MTTLLQITSLALFVMESFGGIVANGFIVLINCIDWFKSRKLSSTDLILTCLGVSRIMWQGLTILCTTMFSFYHTMNSRYSKLAVLWFITDSINLWFAAWLSALYFTKIAIFSHPIFLQVKLRLSGLVPWLLLSSVVFSVILTIVITASYGDIILCTPNSLPLNNSYDSDIELPYSCGYFVLAISAPNFLPLAIFLSSTILLVISLWKHVRHLRNNGIRGRDLNTNVHLNAIKVLVSFAVLYLSSFVAITLQTSLVLINKDCSWITVFLVNVSAVYPPVHGVILILINPKLKQAWVRMVQQLKCPLREMPS